MTRSHQEAEAETTLKHIIASQPGMFGHMTTSPEAAERLALFCATFINAYKKHLIDISNSQFPKKQP